MVNVDVFLKVFNSGNINTKHEHCILNRSKVTDRAKDCKQMYRQKDKQAYNNMAFSPPPPLDLMNKLDKYPTLHVSTVKCILMVLAVKCFQQCELLKIYDLQLL